MLVYTVHPTRCRLKQTATRNYGIELHRDIRHTKSLHDMVSPKGILLVYMMKAGKLFRRMKQTLTPCRFQIIIHRQLSRCRPWVYD